MNSLVVTEGLLTGCLVFVNGACFWTKAGLLDAFADAVDKTAATVFFEAKWGPVVLAISASIPSVPLCSAVMTFLRLGLVFELVRLVDTRLSSYGLFATDLTLLR
jgi:hypothetical protein